MAGAVLRVLLRIEHSIACGYCEDPIFLLLVLALSGNGIIK
jgi:hypothetical protein